MFASFIPGDTRHARGEAVRAACTFLDDIRQKERVISPQSSEVSESGGIAFFTPRSPNKLKAARCCGRRHRHITSLIVLNPAPRANGQCNLTAGGSADSFYDTLRYHLPAL